MENRTLDILLLEKSISKCDATEIVPMFRDLYSNCCTSDLDFYRRQFLSAATTHNHTELRILLISNTHYGSEDLEEDNDKVEYWESLSDYPEIVQNLMSHDMIKHRQGYMQN